MRELLLEMLIALFPFHFYQMFMLSKYYRKNQGRNRLLIGILTAIATVACMKFPIFATPGGFQWDLRSVTIALSFLFGGYSAGSITLVSALLYRAYLGGSSLWFALFIMLVANLIVLPWVRGFLRYRRKIKLIAGAVSAAMSFAIVFLAFVFLLYKHSEPAVELWNTLSSQWALLGLEFLISIGVTLIGVYLGDSMIESYHFRTEVHQTEKMKLISHLAASMAHEVRNPLQVVRGFIQLLEKDATDKSKSYLSVAKTELDRAAEIITDYLTFARPQLNAVTCMNSAEELTQVTRMMAPYANMENVELEHETDDTLYINGDPAKFKQIAVNLLKNSIESMEEGGIVSIRSFREDGSLVLHIRDDGCGMTPDEVAQLGIPYYSSKTKGTGLGLMVTFRLIEAMNGSIEFKSELGEGTEVWVRFPLALQQG